MALLGRYDPLANLSDLDRVAGQKEAWSQFIGEMMSGYAAAASPTHQEPGSPFYDAMSYDMANGIDVDIVWNAFPLETLRQFARDEAFRQVEAPATDPGYPEFVAFRRGTEYCEWHVDKSQRDGMRKVTFTTESPEYWQAMWGGKVGGGKFAAVTFPDGRDSDGLDGPGRVLALYRELLNRDIDIDDLRVKAPFYSPIGYLTTGDYNPYNRWNVKDGIAHLSAPTNVLQAEVAITSKATRGVCDAKGRPLLSPEEILCATGIGNCNRYSDLAICGIVNALAREGRRLTLANPVGIYIDHIDLAGWNVPAPFRPEQCLRHVRGSEGYTTRLVVEIPDGSSDLDAISIGGVPLRHAGQIAECITVRMRVVAGEPGEIRTSPCPCTTFGFLDSTGSRVVRQAEHEAAVVYQAVNLQRAYNNNVGPVRMKDKPPCGCSSPWWP